MEIESKAVRRAEATALDYFAENPERDGPNWVNFLAKLNQARHALAVAKVEATLEGRAGAARGRREGRRLQRLHRGHRAAARRAR